MNMQLLSCVQERSPPTLRWGSYISHANRVLDASPALTFHTPTTRIHTHTLLLSLTHTHTHTLYFCLTHTHTHTLYFSLTHTHTHTHTHTYTHTHTHTHTQTHTQRDTISKE